MIEAVKAFIEENRLWDGTGDEVDEAIEGLLDDLEALVQRHEAQLADRPAPKCMICGQRRDKCSRWECQ